MNIFIQITVNCSTTIAFPLATIVPTTGMTQWAHTVSIIQFEKQQAAY